MFSRLIDESEALALPFGGGRDRKGGVFSEPPPFSFTERARLAPCELTHVRASPGDCFRIITSSEKSARTIQGGYTAAASPPFISESITRELELYKVSVFGTYSPTVVWTGCDEPVGSSQETALLHDCACPVVSAPATEVGRTLLRFTWGSVERDCEEGSVARKCARCARL